MLPPRGKDYWANNEGASCIVNAVLMSGPEGRMLAEARNYTTGGGGYWG